MVGIYFSGTGNSKYAAELFCKEYDNESRTYSIEFSLYILLNPTLFYNLFPKKSKCLFRTFIDTAIAHGTAVA